MPFTAHQRRHCPSLMTPSPAGCSYCEADLQFTAVDSTTQERLTQPDGFPLDSPQEDVSRWIPPAVGHKEAGWWAVLLKVRHMLPCLPWVWIHVVPGVRQTSSLSCSAANSTPQQGCGVAGGKGVLWSFPHWPLRPRIFTGKWAWLTLGMLLMEQNVKCLFSLVWFSLLILPQFTGSEGLSMTKKLDFV